MTSDRESAGQPREHLIDSGEDDGANSAEGEELDSLRPHLDTWQAPVPDELETQRLVAYLTPLLQPWSPVRQALKAPTRQQPHYVQLITLVSAQVSVLQSSFWLGSAAALLVGIVLVLGAPSRLQAVSLYVVGPVLSYLAAESAFRSDALSVREIELACPPSARQLTLARLIVILGYQVGLGLLLSVPLWMWGGQDFVAITFRWLAPLLLVLGVTLLLSLRVALPRAAGLVYTAWLTGIVVLWQSSGVTTPPQLGVPVEIALSMIGLALLAAHIFQRPAIAETQVRR